MNKSFHFTDFTGETQHAFSDRNYGDYLVWGKAYNEQVVEGYLQSGRWKIIVPAEQKPKDTLPERFEFHVGYAHGYAFREEEKYYVTVTRNGWEYNAEIPVKKVQELVDDGTWGIFSNTEKPKTERERQLELAIDHHKLSIAHHELMITKYEKELAQ